MTDARNFLLPDLGEGLTEAEVVAWHVAPGDAVELNQVLVEVETEKAVVELPSPFAGTVVELFAAAGDTVEVGEPLISIATVDAPADPDGVAAPTGEKVSVLVGYGPSEPAPSRRRRRGGRPRHDRPEHPPATPSSPQPSTPGPSTPTGSRPLAAPPVRFMARQEGVDLADVTGHGPGGIITREDLAAHLAGGAAPAQSGRETRSAVKGVQKHMAEAMVRSATTAPQACVFLTVDVTPTSDLLESLRANRRFDGVKLTMLTVAAGVSATSVPSTLLPPRLRRHRVRRARPHPPDRVRSPRPPSASWRARRASTSPTSPDTAPAASSPARTSPPIWPAAPYRPKADERRAQR